MVDNWGPTHSKGSPGGLVPPLIRKNFCPLYLYEKGDIGNFFVGGGTRLPGDPSERVEPQLSTITKFPDYLKIRLAKNKIKQSKFAKDRQNCGSLFSRITYISNSA